MKPIFVFGSNLAGNHAGGAASQAVRMYGAIMGQGEGLQGDSYALPTMSKDLRSLTLSDVGTAVGRFLEFARNHPELRFHITAVGCGIAGFKRENIIPLFAGAPENCFFFEAAFGQVVAGAMV